MTAQASMLIGFVLAIAGLAMWSIPAALVVAGVVLFVAGGLEARALSQKGTRR